MMGQCKSTKGSIEGSLDRLGSQLEASWVVMVKGLPNPRGMHVTVLRVRVRVEIIEPSPNLYH